MEDAVTQMRAYGRSLFEATQWAPALNPHYAVNILRGYGQMAKEGRLPDLTAGSTPTDKAYAYFNSATWDEAAFLSEWAQQETHVAV